MCTTQNEYPKCDCEYNEKCHGPRQYVRFLSNEKPTDCWYYKEFKKEELVISYRREIEKQKQLQREANSDWSYWACQSIIEKLQKELEELEK